MKSNKDTGDLGQQEQLPEEYGEEMLTSSANNNENVPTEAADNNYEHFYNYISEPANTYEELMTVDNRGQTTEQTVEYANVYQNV